MSSDVLGANSKELKEILETIDTLRGFSVGVLEQDYPALKNAIVDLTYVLDNLFHELYTDYHIDTDKVEKNYLSLLKHAVQKR